MHDSLQWKIVSSTEGTLVYISGAITEDAGLERLLAELGHPAKVRFNLESLSRINSVGVRDWTLMLHKIGSTSQIELCECPPVFVAQMNMISNFTAGARVLSIKAPFVCEECDREAAVTIDVSDAQVPELPAVSCSEDESQMVFDDLPELYFKFLKDRTRVAV